jgi:hypothetical protein
VVTNIEITSRPKDDSNRNLVLFLIKFVILESDFFGDICSRLSTIVASTAPATRAAGAPRFAHHSHVSNKSWASTFRSSPYDKETSSPRECPRVLLRTCEGLLGAESRKRWAPLVEIGEKPIVGLCATKRRMNSLAIIISVALINRGKEDDHIDDDEYHLSWKL